MSDLPVLALRCVLATVSSGVLGAQELPPAGLPALPVPPGNPLSAERALLGKALFWDEQLSASGTMACGTCHRPEAGGGDPRPQADPAGHGHPGADGLFGTADDVLGSAGTVRQGTDGLYTGDAVFGLAPQVTRRRSPSVINAAYLPELFWDGRAGGVFVDPLGGGTQIARGAALEAQALAPPVSVVEMAHEGEDWAAIASRLARARPLRLAHDLPAELAAFVQDASYPALFQRVFGSPQVTPTRIALALATYQRTLVSDRSRWDDHLAGVPDALSELELIGRDVFFGEGRCAECHGGQLLSDGLFHDIGVRPDEEDLGRGAVTGLPEDAGRFRTPSLRNVALRAPYFHTGGEPTLGTVVAFYDDGGDFEADDLVQPLDLSPSKRLALVAFLQALTDPRVVAATPPFDRPRLFSESALLPQVVGAGAVVAGAGGPSLIAREPAAVGGEPLALGVHDAPVGAAAWLMLDLAVASPPWTLASGAPLHLAAGGGLLLLPGLVLEPSPSGTGLASWSLPLPTALPVGLEVYAQWLVADPGGPTLLTTSDAVRLTTF